MDIEVKYISKKLKIVVGGDRKFLKWLGIKYGVQYSCLFLFYLIKILKKDFVQEIDDVMFFVEAVNRLYFQLAEYVARIVLEYMQYSYVCLFDKYLNVDGILFGKVLVEELI